MRGKQWHSLINPEPSRLIYNTDLVVDYINRHSSDADTYTAFLDSDFRSNAIFNCKPKTAKKLIRNGYTDLNFFHMANHVRPFPVRGPNGIWYREFRIVGVNYNWVLDHDSTKFLDIKDLLLFYMENKIPVPAEIVRTSEGHFHSKWNGTPELWTFAARRVIAAAAACVSPEIKKINEFNEALRKGGVDPDYFYQPVVYSKIRIPGSVNTKNGHVCEGWINEDYSIKECQEKVKHVGKIKLYSLPSLPPTEQTSKKISPKFEIFESKRPVVRSCLLPGLKRLKTEQVDIFEQFFMEHLNYAMKGTFTINQSALAAKLGIPQMKVSRILQDLIDKKIIYKTKKHFHSLHTPAWSRSAQYGFTGEVLKTIKQFRKEGVERRVEKKHDLALPYLPGASNKHILKDIKCLILELKYDMDDCMKFVRDKYYGNRPHSPGSSLDSQVRSSYKWWMRRLDTLQKVG